MAVMAMAAAAVERVEERVVMVYEVAGRVAVV